ncbi:STAS-like domain-containing protein [uncultured Amphritea sp.]|uniref:STAS-like domain-containing protein n=1 Tax=uncultured Amphritea sp. TaxID=981605 RepID=UPI0025EE7CC9|nr:STAS-like domain-containing protein [uncultured Amphritea sp.]
MSKVIRVVDRFSSPGPRYKKLGPSSGEEFKELLLKELGAANGTELTVNLDGTEGYGSSFLEESFGGLIRDGVSPELVKGIVLVSEEEPDLIDEIIEYINDAVTELNK